MDENKTWVVQLEEDKITGDLMLPFPADLLAQMGWSEGTELWWDITEDGKITIKEKQDEDKSNV